MEVRDGSDNLRDYKGETDDQETPPTPQNMETPTSQHGKKGENPTAARVGIALSYLGQEPPAKVLATAVGQAQDKVGDAILAHVGPRAVAAERTHLHVLVERLPQRSLVVVPPDVPRL